MTKEQMERWVKKGWGFWLEDKFPTIIVPPIEGQSPIVIRMRPDIKGIKNGIDSSKEEG